MNEKEYYENEAFWTEERFLKNNEELDRFGAIRSLIPHSSKSLLDVGCGNGAFLKYLEDNNTKLKLTGFERSQAALSNKICKSDIILGSAEKIDFPDNSFDLVVALEVIEHLPYMVYEKALSEIQRVSKKYIIISVPYCEKGRLIRCNYCGCIYSPSYHLREFNKKRMINLFSGCKLLKTELINRYKKYFVWDFLKDIWYKKIKKDFGELPLYSICPQCGFRAKETSESKRTLEVQSKKWNVKTSLRYFTPFRYSYTWIACLYQKNTF